MFNNHSVGMEISHDGISMVVLSGKHKLPKLHSFSTNTLSSEIMQFSFRDLNISNPSRFISIVRDTYAKLLTPAIRVSLSLPDSLGRIMLLNLETRFKNRQEGADLIRWKLKKNFPLDIDSVHLDYQVLRESEAGGTITLVSLISKQIVSQYEDLLNDSGLEPVYIDFTTFNLYRFFQKRLSFTDNSVFVSFFGGVLSFSAFFEGIIEFYRSKEISAGEFDAERIYREINNTMLVYRNSHPSRVPDELFCVTSLDTENNFSTLAAEVIGMEPQVLHAGDFVTGEKDLFCDGPTLQHLSPALGAAVRSL